MRDLFEEIPEEYLDKMSLDEMCDYMVTKGIEEFYNEEQGGITFEN
ncbi:hypothetical protein [Paraclostridium bifermentans]